MNVINCKGVALGEGRPKTIVSLMDSQPDELIARARRAVAAGADCLEWRLDYMPELLSATNLSATAQDLAAALPNTPLIATLRSKDQGGQQEFADKDYERIMRELICSGGIDFVDFDLGIDNYLVIDLTYMAKEYDVEPIVSYHDFEKTPKIAEMVYRLTSLGTFGATVAKLAVMAHDTRDCLRLMEASVLAAERLHMPIITIAMGEAGALSRLAGESSMSAATFCAFERASAPGQVELSQTIACLDKLHEALI